MSGAGSKKKSNKQGKQKHLNIITWNINRRKNILKDVEDLSKFKPDVIFLQETGIGQTEPEEIGGWKAFYTQYKATEKGAAILVKNELEFKLYNQDADRNGRYIIVQCKLCGQDFTLVSVYNHKTDTTTLGQLLPFLQEMTVGKLVIGGDFNTALNQNDRAKKYPPSAKLHPYTDKTGKVQKNSQHQKIKKFVEKFMDGLQLADVFSEKNKATATTSGLLHEKDYTYRRNLYKNDKNQQKTPFKILLSRLDYFFILKKDMDSVMVCEVTEIKKTDHNPLLVQLKLKHTKSEKAESPHTWKSKDQKKISAAEIVAAIQLLENNKTEYGLSAYTAFQATVIDELKWDYNTFVQEENKEEEAATQNSQVYKIIHPEEFKSTEEMKDFSVEYHILRRILMWRLKHWGQKTPSSNPEQTSEWDNLQHHPCAKDFDFLKDKIQFSSEEKAIMLRGGYSSPNTVPNQEDDDADSDCSDLWLSTDDDSENESETEASSHEQ